MAARLEASRSSEGAIPPPRSGGQEGRRPNVLVVAADPDLLALLKYGLLAQGFDSVWTAGNDDAALVAMYKHRPDYILLDYELPMLNGEAVATATRMLSPRTRIVVYSELLKTPPSWADVFLRKPQIDALFRFFREKAS